jgi:putative DNA primase/helicase
VTPENCAYCDVDTFEEACRRADEQRRKNRGNGDIGTASDDGVEISRLAKLGTLEYEQARKGAADRLNVRASILDRLVAAEREKFNPDEGKQGRALSLPKPEPWPDPVDGAALLQDLSATIRQHVVMADASADVVALWSVYSHAAKAFSIAPRLAITSPVKGCGKTTLMDCLACLVTRPLQAASITSASIFRAVEMARPTLLFDEAERLFGDGGDNEILSILNSGHREGGGALRIVGDDHEPRWFSTFAPAAFALIGRLPDTQQDRSIAIELRRRTADEPVTLFRLDRTHHLHALARRAARWVTDNIDSLRMADPNMGALFNRVADNWRPLFAVANLAGGEWPRRARDAAAVAVARDSESSTGEQLLADIQIIFAQKGVDRVPSGDHDAALAQLEGRPWAEWGRAGKPISPNALARQLKKFKTGNGTPIAPVDIWTGDRNLKGYLLSQFDDAFRHYLAPEGDSEPRNREEPTATGTSTTFATARTEPDLAVGKCETFNNDGHSRGCAVGKPGSSHPANGREAPNRHCDHCGQPGKASDPLNSWNRPGRGGRHLAASPLRGALV